jgi:EpsI family protein
VPLKKALDEIPLNWKGWKGRIALFDMAVLEKLQVTEYIMREYRRGGERISIYIGYYGSQSAGKQIHSPKNCLPGGGWFKLSERQRSLDIDNQGRINFIEAVYEKGSDKEIFMYWYKMKNTYITNEYILKLYMIINSLRYGRNDAAFIRVSSPVTTSVEDTIHMTENAMKDFSPLLTEYLPE